MRGAPHGCNSPDPRDLLPRTNRHTHSTSRRIEFLTSAAIESGPTLPKPTPDPFGERPRRLVFFREGIGAEGKHDAGSQQPGSERESSDEHHVQKSMRSRSGRKHEICPDNRRSLLADTRARSTGRTPHMLATSVGALRCRPVPSCRSRKGFESRTKTTYLGFVVPLSDGPHA